MNRNFLQAAAAATLFALLALTSTAHAQTYDLTWNTVDGGGASSTGGVYELTGTIGQPDAGMLSGGIFTLKGGFWGGIPGPCFGDLNNDRKVDLADLAALLADYGCNTGNCASDLTGDGNTDLGDLAAQLAVYGTICP